jgi:hypothetical protein
MDDVVKRALEVFEERIKWVIVFVQ